MEWLQAAILDQLRSSLSARLVEDKGISFRRIAREYLQIRTKDNAVVPFVLKPLQLRYLALKRLTRMKKRPPRFVLLKYRRGGFTTLEQGLSYWLASRRRNVTVVTLAQKRETTSELFKIPLLMHERDPKAPPVPITSRNRLEFSGLNSSFYIRTAGGSAVSRGETLSRVHWSEVAFSCLGPDQTSRQRILLTSLSEAASHGEVVLESTPNGSELLREIYVDAKMGRNDWTPAFFPWHSDLENSLPVEGEDEAEHILGNLDQEETRLLSTCDLDAGQIKWRRSKRRELKHLFYSEYPDDDETCWLVSGTSYFDPQVMLNLRDHCRGPELIEDRNGSSSASAGLQPRGSRHLPGGYEIEYEPPQSGVDYCMGVDTSEGVPGCDPCGLGVMRRDTGAQVFSLHGYFDPRSLADHVVRVARHYNDALVGIERENHGHAVLQRVIDLGYDSPHHRGGSLYYHSMAKPASISDRPVTRAGWTTNSVTRPVMLESLRAWLTDEGVLDRCFDRLLVLECLTFRMQGDGKFGADSGCHDDAVMKWAIANQMRTVDWRRSRMTVHPVSRWG